MNRKINIGLVNIMPNAGAYESLIRHTLSPVLDQVDIHPIRLTTHQYSSSAAVISKYSTFEQLIAHTQLDLLVVTGAPVENLPYEKISYWQELNHILAYAKQHLKSVMGICFGGLVLAKYLGINKRVLNEKLYGLHHFALGDGRQRYFPSGVDTFCMPISTWAMLEEADVAEKLSVSIRAIAHQPGIGHVMLESIDHKFFIILGHPEYTVDTLYEEWRRDIAEEIPYTRQFNTQSFPEMKNLFPDGSCAVIANWAQSHINEIALNLADQSEPYPT